MNSADGARLVRTLVRLTPGQIAQRVRLRAQRMALERRLPMARWLLIGPDPGSAVGWPAGFRPLDARFWCDSPVRRTLRGGELSLLGMTRSIAPANSVGTADWQAADWEPAGVPLLWRFHLYYWDWAWALGAVGGQDPDARAAFAAVWKSWHGVGLGRGQAWHPYPTALRAWSFCGVYRTLVEDSPIAAPFLADLAAHVGYLRRSLETDVGGNHLIKNLKALAGSAVFFGDDALLARTLSRLRRQLAVQVLSDGGHYERAPFYHCQVLGDLIDVAGLLSTGGPDGEPDWLADSIGKMREWLGAVLDPAGGVPLLNDGFPVSAEWLSCLRPATPPASLLVMLPDTGLVRAAVGRWQLLADVGLPCPRELPAHAHADTLGCLVHVDSEPFLIDTGTSTYEPGAVRDYERSTAAHNTLEMDGADSTEVWGVFRAGRRARVTSLSTGLDASAGPVGTAADAVTIEAAHDGYRHLPGRPVHHRSWRVSADELRIDDTVTGHGRHTIAVRWHLAPDTLLRLGPGGAVVTAKTGDFDVAVTATAEARLSAGAAEVSLGFGRTATAPVLTCVLQCHLPVRISTVWRPGAPHPTTREPA